MNTHTEVYFESIPHKPSWCDHTCSVADTGLHYDPGALNIFKEQNV